MFKIKIFPALFIAATVALLLSVSTDVRSDDQALRLIERRPSAPEFILQDVYGRQHALSNYKGRVVVVNFWATWCPPCREEMPSMQRAADWLAKYNIPLLAIGVGETRNRVLRFLQYTPLTFPLLLDTKSEVMKQWAARSLPTTYILDQNGRVTYLAVGSRRWDSPVILQQILSLKQLRR